MKKGCDLLRAIAKYDAQVGALFLLAGCAAAWRIRAGDEEDINRSFCQSWYEEQMEELCEWQQDEGHDIARAIRLSQALHGDTGRAKQFLRRMADWTDEAVAHPRFWGTIEALAERLYSIKTRMTGRSAVSIMDKAWGPGERCCWPYQEMGRIWRRRFPVPGVRFRPSG